MIRFHQSTYLQTRWIGVDLNTTGHAVVAADPFCGEVMKLGKKTRYGKTASTTNCTKFYREGNLWKLKKIKSREKKEFRSAVNKIARQIVSFAESRCAGIRFEKLFAHRTICQNQGRDSIEFSFENGSFIALLNQVEKYARNHGVPVQYVNPLNTSRKCSRCGAFGKRVRKRFECLQCGRVIHADVNAALNIAAAHSMKEKADSSRERISRKTMRKRMRAEFVVPAVRDSIIPDPAGTLQDKLIFVSFPLLEGNTG